MAVLAWWLEPQERPHELSADTPKRVVADLAARVGGQFAHERPDASMLEPGERNIVRRLALGEVHPPGFFDVGIDLGRLLCALEVTHGASHASSLPDLSRDVSGSAWAPVVNAVWALSPRSGRPRETSRLGSLRGATASPGRREDRWRMRRVSVLRNRECGWCGNPRKDERGDLTWLPRAVQIGV